MMIMMITSSLIDMQFMKYSTFQNACDSTIPTTMLTWYGDVNIT